MKKSNKSVKAEVFMDYDRDGNRWRIKFLEATFEWNQGDTHTFYTSNPVVFGFPDKIITVNEIEYRVQDLIELTEDQKIPIVFRPDGEVEKDFEVIDAEEV